MQKDMLNEIDNLAVLKSYGINIEDAKTPSIRTTEKKEEKKNNSVNSSGKLILEDD